MKQPKRKREATAPSEGADVLPSADAQPPARLFALQSSCTVRDSVALREQLLQLIDDPQPVTLDLRAVERVDTAAMQVLCAFARDRSAAGHPVNWLGAPETFVEAVSLLGMSQSLGITVGPLADAQARA